MPTPDSTFGVAALRTCLPGANISIPGCPGLRFTVTDQGYASFFRRYKVGDKLKQHHVGYWGTRLPDGSWVHDRGRDGERPVSLVEACRRVAEQRAVKAVKRHLGEVHDPAAERRAKRDAARQAREQARREQRAQRLTVRTLWEGRDGYLAKGLADAAPATVRSVTAIYLRDIRPALGAKPVGEVTEADVRAMLDAIEARGSGPDKRPSSRGNKASRKLTRAWTSIFYEWSRDVHLQAVTANPAQRVDRERRRQTRVARRTQRDVGIRTCSLSHPEIAILLKAVRNGSRQTRDWTPIRSVWLNPPNGRRPSTGDITSLQVAARMVEATTPLTPTGGEPAREPGGA